MSEGKTIFEQIKEKVDELIVGRRYIISEVGKLKVTMDKVMKTLPRAEDMEKFLGALENSSSGMQQMQDVFGRLDSSLDNIDDMSRIIKTMESSFEGMTDLRAISEKIATSASEMGKITAGINDIKKRVIY